MTITPLDSVPICWGNAVEVRSIGHANCGALSEKLLLSASRRFRVRVRCVPAQVDH